jgi:hypothetical protein
MDEQARRDAMSDAETLRRYVYGQLPDTSFRAVPGLQCCEPERAAGIGL